MTDILDRLTTALAGRYRLDREIGSGGMALVYLAHDERHDRRVAVKVLRPELSAILGAERFLQEIKVTANLQHSHILPLYDSGAADGLLFYVMPYVEGETLRDRLEREKQLPVGDAVRLSVQVASALDYAHKRNVIHRDIKPENILLRDGDALVADFGIALAVRNAGGNRMTETGMSLGTPQYMSPEQATADRELNARSDIYSLGCVLYEMLAGEPPHTGPTAQAIIARLMTEDPRRVIISRPTVPAHVEVALHTALQRLPADRFATAAEFADALSRPGSGAGTSARFAAVEKPGRAGSDRRQLLLRGAAMGAVLAAAALTPFLLRRAPVSGAETSRHFTIVLPDSAPVWFFAPSYFGEGRPALALSPDGRTLVYTARVRGNSQLWVRPMDRDSAHPLTGTEGAANPTFSPDGQWIAFTVGPQVRKVALSDGRVVTLATTPQSALLSWLSNDRLVADYVTDVAVIAAEGGTPVVLEDTAYVLMPRPMGRDWFVGVRGRSTLALWQPGKQRGLRVRAQDAESADVHGVSPVFVGNGHILLVRDSTLLAMPFSAANRRATGPVAPVLSGVRHESFWGGAQLTASDEGTFVYARGGDAGVGWFVWTTPEGRVVDTLRVAPGVYSDFTVSPDGRWLWTRATRSDGSSGAQIVELRTGLTRDMPSDSTTITPTWWPDGSRIVLSRRDGVVAVPLTGVLGTDTLLGRRWWVTAVSADGEWMVAQYSGRDSSGTWLIGLRAPAAARSRLTPCLNRGTFSPDSRWFTCVAEDGLHVTAVPATGAMIKIAPKGADEPEWSPRGDRIYYRDGKTWYAVPVTTAGGFRSGDPRPIVEARFLQISGHSWDVGPDGRFLMLQGPPGETTTRLDVITDLPAELRRLAPPR